MINNQGGSYFLTLRPSGSQQPAETRTNTASSNLSLKPDPFTGLPFKDAAGWYVKFEAWLPLNESTEKPSKVACCFCRQPVHGLMHCPPPSRRMLKGWIRLLTSALSRGSIAGFFEQQLWSWVMQPTGGLNN